ncbi:MAG: helix-turn-helix domain-containing protein [Armatimonadota bacterium]
MEKIFAVETAQLLGVGHLSTVFPWHMPSHLHQHWEFLYFTRGYGHIELPHATVYPRQFHLMVYPPGLSHAESTQSMEQEEWYYLNVEVAGEAPPGRHLLLPDHDGDLLWLCEHLFHAQQMKRPAGLIQAYLQAFLHTVELLWESGIPVEHSGVDVAIQFMHTHYTEPLTLDALAGVALLSASRFAHLFRARIGVSPMRYLQQVRIEEARRLLATTMNPINDIARRVGFSDPLHFSRVYKTVTAHSPTAYRQSMSK